LWTIKGFELVVVVRIVWCGRRGAAGTFGQRALFGNRIETVVVVVVVVDDDDDDNVSDTKTK